MYNILFHLFFKLLLKFYLSKTKKKYFVEPKSYQKPFTSLFVENKNTFFVFIFNGIIFNKTLQKHKYMYLRL